MRSRVVLALVSSIVLAAEPIVSAADTAFLERLVTCADSWEAWRNDEAQKATLFRNFDALFTQGKGDPPFVPKVPVSIAGMKVTGVYPESVGMGVGFSVVLDTDFARARAAIEKLVGKRLAHCESGDGMRSCDLELAPHRTVMVMAPLDAPKPMVLAGCYYFYAK